MKQNITSIPGYQVKEYLLVLNPSEDLRNKIVNVKKSFYERYEAQSAKSSHPLLMLASFKQYELMEERIVSRLKTIAMGHHSFKVELRDFGTFPSHTIYINVVSKIPIQNLVKAIRSGCQRMMKLNDDNKPYFMMEPHITIACKLIPWQYEKAWLEYSNSHFKGRFIADGMLLMKRSLDDKKYQIVQRFEFMNLPVGTKQGDLFVNGG